MKKYFITFTGYYNPDNSPFSHPGEITYPAFPGKEVIFSAKEHYNRFCGYHEKNLHDCKDFAKIICDTAEFMAGYESDIGVAINSNDEKGFTEVLTEKVHMNAYNEMCDPISLLVIFNARPVRYGRNNVVIGDDVYGLEHANRSIIVWDLEKYIGVLPDDYTIWGIQQNTGKSLSKTDDVMVGLRGGERIFAYR